jgi:hypothetical protein
MPGPLPSHDHCSLILQGDTEARNLKGFIFESYWLKIPGFFGIVKQEWTKLIQAIDSLRRLHIKLNRTVKALKNWGKTTSVTLKSSWPLSRRWCDSWINLKRGDPCPQQKLTSEIESKRSI